MGHQANTPDVLWSKIDKRGPEDCWNWTGPVDVSGYARVQISGIRYLVHRVFFDLANPGLIELKGPKQNDKGSKFVLHSCDNPICCNPRHLRVGTHKENIEDRQKRERNHKWGPDEHPRCKLTVEDVERIREMRLFGAKGRDLAKIFNVSPQTISAANVGRYYSCR